MRLTDKVKDAQIENRRVSFLKKTMTSQRTSFIVQDMTTTCETIYRLIFSNYLS